MRTRELMGVGLAFLLWCYPLVLILTLAAWLEGDLPAYGFLFAFLLGFAWPGCFLLSRRLREPSELDVIEADGRATVLVLHPYRAEGIWLRLLPTPAFFRDVGDSLQLRALRRSLGTVGPLLRIERVAPPRTHGPMGHPEGPEREAALLRAVGRAALVVIIVDGTEANRREIEIIGDVIDIRRIILVLPPTVDHAFLERWQGLREGLPGLPELERRTAAVRFEEDATPIVIDAPFGVASSRRKALASASLMVRTDESRPQPKPPPVSHLLTVLPIAVGFASAIFTPFVLDELRLEGQGGVVLGGLLSIVLGFVLAAMSRRYMRLVPANELPMVLVAAFPWLSVELFTLLVRPHEVSHEVSSILHASGQGAAYAVPLLLATSIVLSGATLIRRSPGRRWWFMGIGPVAVAPLVILATTLEGMDPGMKVSGLIGAIVVGGFVLGIATVAASGEPGRRHAPLSIGAPVCAALAIAAWLAATGHGALRAALDSLSYGPRAELMRVGVAPLIAFDTYAGWLVLALPLCVVWAGLRFRGRATKTAAGNAFALLPLVLLWPLVMAGHGRAHRLLDEGRALFGARVYLQAAGNRAAPGFELVGVSYGTAVEGPADIVVDRGGALADGRRVSSAVELSSFGSTGGPALSRAIARVVSRDDRSHVRVAAASDAGADAMLTVFRVVWSYDSLVDLIATASDGYGVFYVVRPYHRPTTNGLQNRTTEFWLRLSGGDAVLEDRHGTRIEIPRDPRGALTWAELRARLSDRRRMEPNRRALIFVVQGGATAQDLIGAMSVAQEQGFDDLLVTNRRM